MSLLRLLLLNCKVGDLSHGTTKADLKKLLDHVQELKIALIRRQTFLIVRCARVLM